MAAGDSTLVKGLPSNVEAERSVLGAVLLDNSAYNQAAALLRPEDFSLDSHRRIFLRMTDMAERSRPVDLVTLCEELMRNNEMEAIGGVSYISSLTDGLPRLANIEHYAKIVKDKSLLRRLIQISETIVTRCVDGAEEAEEILDQAEAEVLSVGEQRIRGGFLSFNDIFHTSFQSIDALHDRGKRVTGLETGFRQFDDMTRGLQPSDLIIIAARPSVGKTSFALDIARWAAVHRKDIVGLFSLEMSREALVLRMLCSEADVDSHRLQTGFASRDDWTKMALGLGRLTEAPIFIDDTPGLTITEMRAKARRLKAEFGLSLLVVDYLQLMGGRLKEENRTQEISAISRGLKGLAKELNVPLVAISQLSRAPETRGGRPRLSDLRECVTGETLVVLADGRRVPIRDLVDTQPEVVSVAENGQLLYAQTDRIWRVGTKPTFRVVLASGRVIRTTERHRLLGPGGWKTIGEFHVGDRVAIARRLPEPAIADKWPEARLALLGQLIGDGSYLVHQPLRYTTSCEENSRIVADAAQAEFGAKVKRYDWRTNWHQVVISGNGNRWHPAGLNAWLRQLGIFGQHSYQKRIPGDVFRLSNQQIAILLRHLWATDGTIVVPKSGTPGCTYVNFSTNSPGLASDVAALLLRLGIVARIASARKADYRPGFNVRVSGTDAQDRFLAMIGAFGPRIEQARRLRNFLDSVKPNTNVDTLPREDFLRVRALMRLKGISQRRMAANRGTSYGGSSHFQFAPSRRVMAEYAEILNDEMLRLRVKSDLFWDRIVSIEAAGEEEVYDLTVPGSASWLADAIISHNSGQIEQDADLVALLYREDLLNPTDANRGRAEVIIAKQRNGPTGTVELVFLPQFTSFRNPPEAFDSNEME